MKNKIKKQTLLILYISISLILLSSGGHGEDLNGKIAGSLDNFTYMWLSGNSKIEREEYRRLKDMVSEKKPEPKMKKWISLGKAYLAAMDYEKSIYSALQSSTKETAGYSDRINFIFSMINPDLKFNSNLIIRKKGLKDYDYFWIGNYYLLQREFKKARYYYMQGIKISSRLLSSFDIMMGVAEEAPLKKTRMSFICALPYIRIEDLFFFLTNELSLTDHKLVIREWDDFDPKDIKKSLEKNIFPLYIRGDSAYLSLGDLLLALHTCIIKNEKEGLLTDSKDVDYLKKGYRKIAAYMLKKRLIKPYIDGRLHLNSPVSGYFFADLYNNFTKKTK